MSVVAAILAFAIVTLGVYLGAGWWVSSRARRREDRSDRILRRALDRSNMLVMLTLALLLGATLGARSLLSPFRSAVILYLLPLLWLWAATLGVSWLQIRARRLEAGLLRFSRFDLFTNYLTIGQRLPFVSAALAASSDLSRGADLLPEIALHFGIALLLGYLGRWLVVRHVVALETFPDASLIDEIGEVARGCDIRLRGAYLIPTERGQSVNAFAATSSRVIYVAEGIYRGLDRGEVKAVLLHELGHFAQRVTNVFRNLAVVGTPVAIWAFLAAFESRMTSLHAWLHGAAVAALWLAASRLTSLVYRFAEHRADRFAERHGRPGALASSLRKLYERNRVERTESGSRHPSLRDRLEVLEADGHGSPDSA
jgi:Zn-dependent protease with chaperone function